MYYYYNIRTNTATVYVPVFFFIHGPQFNSIQFKVLFKVDTYSIHITQILMSF